MLCRGRGSRTARPMTHRLVRNSGGGLCAVEYRPAHAEGVQSRRGRHLQNLQRAKRWADATPCVPHRKHSYIVSGRYVVDVITRPLQQDATRTGYWRLLIESAEIWRVANYVEAAVSSWRNRFGDASRFLRHQPSISRICSSASGVLRTGRVTGCGAVRRESRKPVEDDPTPRTSKTPLEPRAARDAPRL